VRFADDLVWVAARAEWSPRFEYLQQESATAVDRLSGAPGGEGYAYCWAWEDEEAGRVRARSFVAEAGIAEDEATGSAALALCVQLGRDIEVRQGKGSEIAARLLGDGWAEIGGRVVLDEVRQYRLPKHG
jgi:predicted PhzF superfamily epimerase YddE/YHI9